MPAYVLPIATFGDLAAFDLEATVTCRCGRHTVLDATSDALRDRPIGHSRFRCSTHLPDNRTCGQVHVATLRKRGRAGWTLADHWRAMMDRNPEAEEPGRIRTFRDHVQAGSIAWLSDTGCHPGGFVLQMIAFDRAALRPLARPARRPDRVPDLPQGAERPDDPRQQHARRAAGGLRPGPEIGPLSASQLVQELHRFAVASGHSESQHRGCDFKIVDADAGGRC